MGNSPNYPVNFNQYDKPIEMIQMKLSILPCKYQNLLFLVDSIGYLLVIHALMPNRITVFSGNYFSPSLASGIDGDLSKAISTRHCTKNAVGSWVTT